MRIFIKYRSVGADVAGWDVLLLADGGRATSGKAGSAGADEFGEASEQLALCAVDFETEVFLEEVGGLLKVAVRVPGVLLVKGMW